MAKTLKEQIIEAEERGNAYLYRSNVARERGEYEKAAKLDERGQFWLDRYNKLVQTAC